MAVNKFYQTPDSFRTTHTMDDWIQEAMIILFDLCSSYDSEKGPFDNYARFIISKRLISMQRDIFRKNPPVNEDLRKIAVSLKRENSREPSVKELSDITGRSENEIREFMETGVGKRVFAKENEGVHEKKEVKIGMTPEEQYIRLEARKILWDCVEKLEPGSKLLFVRHELQDVSLENLYDNLNLSETIEKTDHGLKLLFLRHEFEGASFENLYENPEIREIFGAESLRTFKRRYRDKVYQLVYDCVKARYE